MQSKETMMKKHRQLFKILENNFKANTIKKIFKSKNPNIRENL